MWLKLHPKVKQALAAALAIGIVDVGAQVTDHYPKSPLIPLVALFIPVLAGWAKKVSEDAE